MIKSGYASVNESVSGPLAAALKSADAKAKRSLIYALKQADIDFDRSIGNAEKIKDNDPRLKVDGNIVIGVFTDANDKKCLAAYQVGKGAIVKDNASITMVKDNSGKVVKLPNFENVSWKKWISIMDSFYIIEKDKAVPVQGLIKSRRDNQKSANDSTKSDALTKRLKDLCKKYNYTITFRSDRFGDIELNDLSLRNNDYRSPVNVTYNSGEFRISTVGSHWTEEDASELRNKLSEAIEFVHKLKQININRLKNIKPEED